MALATGRPEADIPFLARGGQPARGRRRTLAPYRGGCECRLGEPRSTVHGPPSPFSSVTAVAPNPTTGSRRPDPDDRDRRLERQPVRLGHRHGPAAGAVEAVQVEGDVPRVDPRATTPRPAADGGAARPRAEHPRPELGDAATRPASATRSRRGPGRRAARRPPPDRRPVDGGDEVGVAAAAGHREGHPPDVARRRRVGRVEVAVGVEPGDREPAPGRAAAGRPSPRRGTCSRRRARAGARRSGRPPVPASPPRRSRSARQVLADRGRGSSPAGRDRAPSPGRSAASPWSSDVAPGQARPRAQALDEPERRGARAGVRSMPAKWPPSAVGEPTITIGRIHGRAYGVPHRVAMMPDAHRRLRPRALLRPLGVRGRAPPVRLRRPGLPDGRAPRAGRRRDPRDVGRPHPRLHRVDRPPAAPRARSRRSTTSLEPDDVLVFAGAEEAIFCLVNVAARAGRPRHRHLARLPEPVRGRARGRRRRDAPRAARGRAAGRSTSTCCARQVTPATRSSSSTRRTTRPGCCPTGRPSTRSSTIAEEAGAHLLVDEVYRFLEFDEADRLPAGADALPSGISLGVMSKSFAMAGLRIGWLATRDRELLERCAAFKDYTTICSSAPSEILALIGLRARDAVLERSRGIVAANLALLDALLRGLADRFTWVRPRRRLGRLPAADRAGRRDRRLGRRAGRGRGRAAAAGLAVRLRRQPLPARASGGPTCPRRSRGSRSSPRRHSDDRPGPASAS